MTRGARRVVKLGGSLTPLLTPPSTQYVEMTCNCEQHNRLIYAGFATCRNPWQPMSSDCSFEGRGFVPRRSPHQFLIDKANMRATKRYRIRCRGQWQQCGSNRHRRRGNAGLEQWLRNGSKLEKGTSARTGSIRPRRTDQGYRGISPTSQGSGP